MCVFADLVSCVVEVNDYVVTSLFAKIGCRIVIFFFPFLRRVVDNRASFSGLVLFSSVCFFRGGCFHLRLYFKSDPCQVDLHLISYLSLSF